MGINQHIGQIGEWCFGEEHETMISIHHMPTGARLVCSGLKMGAEKRAVREAIERLLEDAETAIGDGRGRPPGRGKS